MSVRFYAAWAIALVLALVLPIAVPYAVSRDDGSPCARDARGAIAGSGVLQGLPLSVEVQECTILPDRDPRFRAEITVRGPYGILIALYRVNSQGYSVEYTDNRMVIAGIALLTGMVAVSMPFTFFQLRASLSRRLHPAL